MTRTKSRPAKPKKDGRKQTGGWLLESIPKRATPKKVQFRKRSEYSVTDPSFIPDVLRNDGLTEEVFMRLVDEYLTHRIEPEELMFAPIHGDWNGWTNSMFTHQVEGVRFVNEIDAEPEFTTVYRIYDPSDYSFDASFHFFFGKWNIEIKEKCWAELIGEGLDRFWFVIEFRKFEPNKEMGVRPVHHTVSLAEGSWYTIEHTEPNNCLVDFSLHHVGF